ncbi:structure-specific endonuclease subunit slx1 isoform X2 [Cephus cinctus]|uniref:Structure-specific endonuclease subunit SLX1 homolog n=1 Tax=Cephus cinctus TaxID=211228 RepID=A0AAJ7FIA5_CEPCN|nr:structure-specific endonuclease subunit slx1 isoform X2 [Cephus cinctus]
MEDVDEVEHFFGVYLLYCKNPKYKGRTYIGYTVDAKRRIKQHNAGAKFGGAWRTSNKGPWTMVLIVHGFPNDISALKFEWAWQHSDVSRRLRHVPKKKSKQKTFDYRISVLNEMLKIGPWCRLPLTIRWLDSEFANEYSMQVSPPLHMPISYSKVVSRKIGKKSKKKNALERKDLLDDLESILCSICGKFVGSNEKLTCVKPGCFLISHIVCLAEKFSTDDMILPIEDIF